MPTPRHVYTLVFVLIWCCAVQSDPEIIDAHLIPHSHCDPGWLETYEVLIIKSNNYKIAPNIHKSFMQGYYHSKVSQILTNVVEQLTKNSTRTFIWSEV